MRRKSFWSCLSAIVALMVISLSVAHAAQQGKILEGLTMKSAIQKHDINYTIYLPPDYDVSQRTYPIVYLLHGGAPGGPVDWYIRGMAGQTMDRMIADGKIPPMILVTPDGRRNDEPLYNSYYMNDANGAFHWEDMFIKEFIPFIESTYRVAQQSNQGKGFRSIAGLSMGGFGAVIYAWLYPDLFQSAVGLSAGLRTEAQITEMDQEGYEIRYGKPWGIGLVGNARLSPQFDHYQPMRMIKRLDDATLSKTRLYLDIGAEDPRHLEANNQLHQMLFDRQINHVFKIRPGGHVWKYWRTGLPEALQFIADGIIN